MCGLSINHDKQEECVAVKNNPPFCLDSLNRVGLYTVCVNVGWHNIYKAGNAL